MNTKYTSMYIHHTYAYTHRHILGYLHGYTSTVTSYSSNSNNILAQFILDPYEGTILCSLSSLANHSDKPLSTASFASCKQRKWIVTATCHVIKVGAFSQRCMRAPICKLLLTHTNMYIHIHMYTYIYVHIFSCV